MPVGSATRIAAFAFMVVAPLGVAVYLITAELERCLEGESHVMVPEAGHVVFTNRSFFDDAVLSFLLEY